jgi:hypothetical protein
MALIVETGAIVAGSNSFNTLIEADAYFADRGVVTWTDLTDADKTIALIKAVDFLESTYSSAYIGERLDASQPLSFPRYGVKVYGFTLLETTIPVQLKKAQLELAFRSLAGDPLIQDEERTIIRERIDVIDTYYATYGSQQTRFVEVERILNPLFKNTFGTNSGTVKLERT